ncbi:MAG: hypothetical protein IKI75_13635 [Lachnospiraceae bacterium]|nr:hypothetical protein [Lachnospiraceae bacterium]
MKNYRLIRLEDEGDGVKRFVAVGRERKALGEIDVEFHDAIVDISFLYVPEEHRREGVGSFMLQSVIDILDDGDYFTPVELRFPLDEENGSLMAFMHAQKNFYLEEAGTCFTISAADRKNSKNWKRMREIDTDAVEYVKVDEKIRRKFAETLDEEGYADFLNDETAYDRRLCFARVNHDRVTAASFLRLTDEGKVEVSFLYAQEEHQKSLQNVICASMYAVDELFPRADLVFTTVTPEGYAMGAKIFGEEGKRVPLFCARWDGISGAGLREACEMIGMEA